MQQVGGNLFLTLVGQIENAYGTDFDDAIYGNSADNKLYGLGGNDLLEGRDGDDTLQAGLRRVVFLDLILQLSWRTCLYSVGNAMRFNHVSSKTMHRSTLSSLKRHQM